MEPTTATSRAADPWLMSASPILRSAPPGRFLDLACGAGRNSLYLARIGIPVQGVDLSAPHIATAVQAAREAGCPATFAVQEVGAEHFPLGPWAGICIFHFLDRELFNVAPRHLLPGGLLVCKTHLGLPTRSPWLHPRRSAYLLRPGELLCAFPGLLPARYSEWSDEDGRAFAGLVARRPYSS